MMASSVPRRARSHCPAISVTAARIRSMSCCRLASSWLPIVIASPIGVCRCDDRVTRRFCRGGCDTAPERLARWSCRQRTLWRSAAPQLDRGPALPRPHVTTVAAFTNAGSIVTPRPGPDGTVRRPLTARSVEVSDETGSESSLPLYSWNGPALGTQEA